MKADGVFVKFCHSKWNFQGSPQFELFPTMRRQWSTNQSNWCWISGTIKIRTAFFIATGLLSTYSTDHHSWVMTPLGKQVAVLIRTYQTIMGLSTVWCTQCAIACGGNRMFENRNDVQIKFVRSVKFFFVLFYDKQPLLPMPTRSSAIQFFLVFQRN